MCSLFEHNALTLVLSLTSNYIRAFHSSIKAALNTAQRILDVAGEWDRVSIRDIFLL